MKKIILLTAMAAIVAFSGCQNEAITPAEDNLPDLRPISASEKVVVEASNNFAFKLNQEINNTGDQNYFISPLSVSYALAMTSNGAAGETKSEIKQLLDYGNLTDPEMNQAFADLTNFLLGLDKKTTMELANSIWYRNSMQVKPAFAETMKDFYQAGINGLNFSDPGAVDVINNWIADHTAQKIQNVLSAIPADAVMYLINALYFKADWAYQFDASLTKKENFNIPGGTVQVDMMESEGAKVSYFRNEEVEFVDIPYGNGQFSMTIMMPSGIDQWQHFSGQFDQQKLNQWIQSSDTLTTRLKLPKFKMEYKKKLNEQLYNLGMKKAFAGGAEFPDFFEGNYDLAVSEVIHQTFLEVDEKGSEAAAVTVVGIELTSVGSKPAVVAVNRPFMFMIREKHSNTILFLGKMSNPGL